MKAIKKLFGKYGNKKLKVLVSVLAVIVVFTTTYSLILPAITIDNETAQEEPGLVISDDEIISQEDEPVVQDVIIEADPVAAEAVAEEVPVVEEAIAEAEQEIAGDVETEAIETETESVDSTEPEVTTRETENTETKETETESIEETEPEATTRETENIETTEPGTTEPETTEPEATSKESESSKETEPVSSETTETAETSEDTTAETETTTAVMMPAVILTGETNKDLVDKNLPNIIVTVTAEADTFPEGTTMKVRNVANDSIIEDAVKNAVDKDPRVTGEVKTIQTIDITFFDKDGKEIEPLKEIKVTFKSDSIKEIDDPVLVHIPDEGKGEAKVVDQLSEQEAVYEGKSDSEIMFRSDDFSKYVIVETETITTHVITADGQDYAISVTYDETSGLPAEGVTLEATELDTTSAAFENYLNQVDTALGNDVTISTAKLFDISILVNGVKTQPLAPVKVDIQIQGMQVPEDNSITVVHFTEDNAATEVEFMAEENIYLEREGETVNAVTFNADGFSVYGIVGTETLTAQYITAEGETFNISITIPAEAGIPEGSEIVVDEIKEGTTQYQYSFKNAQEFVGEDLSYGRFFDISIVKDGKKIQPKVPVQVDIKLDNSVALASGAEIIGLHVTEDGLEPLVVDAAGTEYAAMTDVDTLTFETKGFSEFDLLGTSAYNTVLLAASAPVTVNATVGVEGVDGITTKTITTGKFAGNESLAIENYVFQEAWYKDIPIDGLFYDPDEQVYYGTIDGNRITGVEIDPVDVRLVYAKGVYSVTYAATVAGTEVSDYETVAQITGRSAIGIAGTEDGTIQFYVNPKTGYTLQSVTASNGSISGPDFNKFYTLSGVTADTKVTVALTEETTYNFKFTGSNTRFSPNNSSWYDSGSGYNRTYTANETVTFYLDGYDQWNYNGAGSFVLNKLSISIGDDTVSANIPDSQGQSEITTVGDYTITVTRGASNTKTKNRYTRSYPTYTVSITGKNGGKVRGDIAIDTNYKVIVSSEVVAKQLDGVEPIAYNGYYSSGNSARSYYANTDTGGSDERIRLSDEVFSKYPRDQGGQTRITYFFIKLTGEYAAEDLTLRVVDYNADNNTYKTVLEKKVSELDHIDSNKITPLNNNSGNPATGIVQAATYTTSDYQFSIGTDSNNGAGRALTDVRIYVIYTPKPEQEYTVKYDLDGGDSAVPVDTGTYTQSEGSNVASITNDLPTKEGYTFQGWYLEGDPDTIYQARDPFIVNSESVRLANADHEFVFIAKWTDQHIANMAPYTVNVYLQNEDFTYDDGEGGREDNPIITSTEHGEVGTTAYIIKSELEAWLAEEVLPEIFNDLYEFDRQTDDLIVASGKAVIKVYYKRKTVDVDISKTVIGSETDKQKDFTFIYKIGENGTEQTFTLKHGQSLSDIASKINVLKRSDFYIKEIVEDGFEVSATGAEKEAEWYKIEQIGENTTIAFTNTRVSQTVKIVKTGDNTTGASIAGAEFTLANSEYGTLTSSENGTVTSSSGASEFKLNAGTDYTLTETKAPAYFEGLSGAITLSSTTTGLTMTVSDSDSEKVTLSEPDTNGIYTITIENTRKKATVTVIKNVVGSDEDKDSQYNFAATNLDPGSFQLYGRQKDASGATAAQDNSKVYTNVLYGTTISVTEANTYSEFDTEVSIKIGDADATTTTALSTGDVLVTDDVVITFTNTRRVTSITIKKVDDKHIFLPGSKFKLYEVVPTGENGGTTDVIVGDEFSIDAQAGVTIDDLPSGDYKLTETKAPDGYVIISGPIEFSVDATGTGNVVSWKGSRPEAADSDPTTTNKTGDTITVKNTPGQALPNTGGSGTLPYTLGGMMLIIASALMYGFRMRRRERRLN